MFFGIGISFAIIAYSPIRNKPLMRAYLTGCKVPSMIAYFHGLLTTTWPTTGLQRGSPHRPRRHRGRPAPSEARTSGHARRASHHLRHPFRDRRKRFSPGGTSACGTAVFQSPPLRRPVRPSRLRRARPEGNVVSEAALYVGPAAPAVAAFARTCPAGNATTIWTAHQLPLPFAAFGIQGESHDRHLYPLRHHLLPRGS